MTDKLEQNTPPAEALKTEPETVPYSRLQEVVGQKNKANTEIEELKAQLAESEATRQKQKDAELTEQNRWQELAESRAIELEAANLKATRTDELEAALLQTLEARIEAIPENMRSIVPSHGTPQERLAWLNENAEQLTMPKAPVMDGGAGSHSGGGAQLPTLTAMEKELADQFGMTHEKYAKRKAARLAESDEDISHLSA